VGFVYVFPETKLQFEYELKKYQLTFEKLKSVNGMIYLQPDDALRQMEVAADVVHNLRFIQSERDDYLRYGNWKTENGEEINIKDDISVITNSDYVMHAFLEKNSVANLSADSFNSFDLGVRPGIKLINDNGEIEFGVIKNLNGKVSPIAEEFVDYICDQLRRK